MKSTAKTLALLLAVLSAASRPEAMALEQGSVPVTFATLTAIGPDLRNCTLSFTPVWYPPISEKSGYESALIDISAICHTRLNGDNLDFLTSAESAMDDYHFVIPSLGYWQPQGNWTAELEAYLHEFGLDSNAAIAKIRTLRHQLELLLRLYQLERQGLVEQEAESFLQANLNFRLGHTGAQITQLQEALQTENFDGSELDVDHLLRDYSDTYILAKIAQHQHRTSEQLKRQIYNPSDETLAAFRARSLDSGALNTAIGLFGSPSLAPQRRDYANLLGMQAVDAVLAGSSDPLVLEIYQDYCNRQGPFATLDSDTIESGLLTAAGLSFDSIATLATMWGSGFLTGRLAQAASGARAMSVLPQAVRAPLAQIGAAVGRNSELIYKGVFLAQIAATTLQASGISKRQADGSVIYTEALFGKSTAAHLGSGVALNSVVVALPILVLGPKVGLQSLRARLVAAMIGSSLNNGKVAIMTALQSWADAKEAGKTLAEALSDDPLTYENMKRFNMTSAGSSLYILLAMMGSQKFGASFGMHLEVDDGYGAFRDNLQRYLQSSDLSALGLRTIAALLDADGIIGAGFASVGQVNSHSTSQSTHTELASLAIHEKNDLAQHRQLQGTALSEVAAAADLSLETTQHYLSSRQGCDWLVARIQARQRQMPQLQMTGTDGPLAMARNGNDRNLNNGQNVSPRLANGSTQGSTTGGAIGGRGVDGGSGSNGRDGAAMQPPTSPAPQNDNAAIALIDWQRYRFTGNTRHDLNALVRRIGAAASLWWRADRLKIELSESQRRELLYQPSKREALVRNLMGNPPAHTTGIADLLLMLAKAKLEANLQATLSTPIRQRAKANLPLLYALKPFVSRNLGDQQLVLEVVQWAQRNYPAEFASVDTQGWDSYRYPFAFLSKAIHGTIQGLDGDLKAVGFAATDFQDQARFADLIAAMEVELRERRTAAARVVAANPAGANQQRQLEADADEVSITPAPSATSNTAPLSTAQRREQRRAEHASEVINAAAPELLELYSFLSLLEQVPHGREYEVNMDYLNKVASGLLGREMKESNLRSLLAKVRYRIESREGRIKRAALVLHGQGDGLIADLRRDANFAPLDEAVIYLQPGEVAPVKTMSIDEIAAEIVIEGEQNLPAFMRFERTERGRNRFESSYGKLSKADQGRVRLTLAKLANWLVSPNGGDFAKALDVHDWKPESRLVQNFKATYLSADVYNSGAGLRLLFRRVTESGNPTIYLYDIVTHID